MTTELTDATNVTLESATYENLTDDYTDNRTDEVEVSRWSKKGDRLYINGPAKYEKNSTYFDLVAGEMQDLPGSRNVTVERDGDTVTVTVADTGGLGYDEEWTFVLELEFPGDEDADDEDDEEDEDEPEIVADGGEDASDIVTDEEIEEAIERHDDPGHEDAYTVEEIRDTLAAINADILEWWDEHQDAIDEGAYEIIHEDRDVIVLADRGGHFYQEQFDVMDIGDEHGILSSIVVNLHHTAARNCCDYSWSAVRPVVVRKTAEFRAGEQQILREIARRTDELGSVARAVDTLATETHGWSKSSWANLTGRNPSTVSRMTDNEVKADR